MRSWWILAFAVTACSSGGGSSLTGGEHWGVGSGHDGTGGGGGGSTGGGMTGGGGGGGGGNMTPQTEAQLEPSLVLSEIAFFQGVKVGVMKGGNAATRKAPIVAGRDALVRAYVTPGNGYTAHEVTARMVIETGGVPTTIDAKLSPSAASTDDNLGSTFNFNLKGAQIGPDSKIKVALLDASKMVPLQGSTMSTARWPADGTQASLDAKSSGNQIKVVIVPVRYGFDGSNRLPDTTANQIQLYAQTMFAMYPTPKVDVTVRNQPVSIAFAVNADGTGWNQLLSTILSVRAQDNAGADVYYYGAFNPAASMQTYCGGGCVAGLSPVVMNIGDAANRGSIGLGFTGNSAAVTMAHEIGHAHGLPHAPCGGAAGTDPNFPYTNAGIGSWGYSLGSQQLVSPAMSKDVMSYCNPQWISDYNFNLLFTRVKGVNNAFIAQGPPVSYRYASVEPDGSIVFTGTATLTTTPGGKPVGVHYSSGDSATAYFYPSDHVAGGTLLVPDRPGEVSFDVQPIALSDLAVMKAVH